MLLLPHTAQTHSSAANYKSYQGENTVYCCNNHNVIHLTPVTLSRRFIPTHSVTSTSSRPVSPRTFAVRPQVGSLLKIFLMTSGSSSCTSCTNQAEEMQKGANDKGSLCCLGHKETQWGSEWAADFYHSGSLSFSLMLTFAVTSSKNKLLLNYSWVNLQN